jgi:hypothetical protein
MVWFGLVYVSFFLFFVCCCCLTIVCVFFFFFFFFYKCVSVSLSRSFIHSQSTGEPFLPWGDMLRKQRDGKMERKLSFLQKQEVQYRSVSFLVVFIFVFVCIIIARANVIARSSWQFDYLPA